MRTTRTARKMPVAEKFPWLVLIVVVVLLTNAKAFPPAPYYTVYGFVRDQVGQVIDADGAYVVLLKGVREVGRTPIRPGTVQDFNYELRMRIDSDLPSTESYLSNAIPANGAYSLAVDISGTFYYPIEVAGNLTAGIGGERVRLDLTLGEDSDGDGLPDAWEQWQLYQSGLFDGSGAWDLSLITRDGDFDSDGFSNWQEYIAGTFAGDSTEFFELDIKEVSGNNVRLEFYAITGKTYTIERSTDLQNWIAVPFTPVGEAESLSSFQAEAVGVQSVVSDGTTTDGFFYRVTVR